MVRDVYADGADDISHKNEDTMHFDSYAHHVHIPTASHLRAHTIFTIEFRL